MNELHFQNLMKFFRKRHSLLIATVYSSKIITLIVFLSYPILLVTLLYRSSDEIIRAVLIPAISYIVLSVFRWFYNAKRPYEVYDFTPIMKVDGKKGKSFPSRHIFSAMIIAFTFMWISAPLGIVYIILGLLLAVLRVLCGVHFIKDVLAGAGFAAFVALIGFVLI